MDIKRAVAWVLIAMPLLAACDNDDDQGTDDGSLSAEVTIQDLAGEWFLKIPSPEEPEEESFVIQPDGSYQYYSTFARFDYKEGHFKIRQYYAEGKISCIGNHFENTTNMEIARFADNIDDIEQAQWYLIPADTCTYTIDVSLLYDGSVMVLEYYIDDENPSLFTIEIFFKKGATNLPSGNSLLQGTWYGENGTDTVRTAMRFCGDTVELYSSVSFTSLYRCPYTYRDGVVLTGTPEFFLSRDSEGNDILNPTDPFNVDWQPASAYNVTDVSENGFAFVLIIGDKKSYYLRAFSALYLTRQ